MLILLGIPIIGALLLIDYSAEYQDVLPDVPGHTQAGFTIVVLCALSLFFWMILFGLPLQFCREGEGRRCWKFWALIHGGPAVIVTQLISVLCLISFYQSCRDALRKENEPILERKEEEQTTCFIQQFLGMDQEACNDGESTLYSYTAFVPDKCPDQMLYGNRCGKPLDGVPSEISCFVGDCDRGQFGFVFDAESSILDEPPKWKFIVGILCVYSYWILIILSIVGGCVILIKRLVTCYNSVSPRATKEDSIQNDIDLEQ